MPEQRRVSRAQDVSLRSPWWNLKIPGPPNPLVSITLLIVLLLHRVDKMIEALPSAGPQLFMFAIPVFLLLFLFAVALVWLVQHNPDSLMGRRLPPRRKRPRPRR